MPIAEILGYRYELGYDLITLLEFLLRSVWTLIPHLSFRYVRHGHEYLTLRLQYVRYDLKNLPGYRYTLPHVPFRLVWFCLFRCSQSQINALCECVRLLWACFQPPRTFIRVIAKKRYTYALLSHSQVH